MNPIYQLFVLISKDQIFFGTPEDLAKAPSFSSSGTAECDYIESSLSIYYEEGFDVGTSAPA